MRGGWGESGEARSETRAQKGERPGKGQGWEEEREGPERGPAKDDEGKVTRERDSRRWVD